MQQQGLLQKAEQIFTSFIEQIEEEKLNDVAIRRAVKKYDVKNLKINNVTPLRARRMYASILPKYEAGVTTDKNWLENERRLFLWCAVCYLHKTGMEISQLKDEDYGFFKAMFPLKELELIRFQIHSLVKRDNKSSSWKKEEDRVLTQIVMLRDANDDIEWSAIAKEFFSATHERFLRNAKQCRERWLNHLDPNKSKGKWLHHQDVTLLKEVLARGKKWSQIAVALENRKNEHMVKNRYKSLIHKKEKELKTTKLKENIVIQMILNDLQERRECGQEISQEGPAHSNEQEEELFEEADEELNVKKEEANHHERPQREGAKAKKQCRIIVGPNKNIVTDPMVEDEEEREQEDRNEIEVYGNRTDLDFGRLFQNATTPIGLGAQDNNRYSSFDSRSPHSFFLPNYPSGCWTPILIMDGPPNELSPQMTFGNFGTKFKKNFHEFVGAGEEEENPQNK